MARKYSRKHNFIIGQRLGHTWTYLGDAPKDNFGNIRARIICEKCDKVRWILRHFITPERIRPCSCAKTHDLRKRTFGKWKAISFAEHRKGGASWNCKCTCGTERVVNAYALLKGFSKSCGCGGGNKKHGMTNTRTWNSWSAMKERCGKKEGYEHISYDPKWETFEGFYEDMGERPEGCTLDRIDPDGNYCKENCRWAGAKVQARNKRKDIVMRKKDYLKEREEYENKIKKLKLKIRALERAPRGLENKDLLNSI